MNIAPKNIKLSLLIVLTSLSLYASPAPPEPTPGIVPPGLPIDGSIVLLFIVAIAYGLYSLKKFKLQSK